MNATEFWYFISFCLAPFVNQNVLFMNALMVITVITLSVITITACDNYDQTQREISQNGPQIQ